MLRDVITTIQKLVNNGTLALESNSIGTMTVSNLLYLIILLNH